MNKIHEIILKALSDDDYKQVLLENPRNLGESEDLTEAEVQQLLALGFERIAEEIFQIDEEVLAAACAWCNNSSNRSR